MNAPLRVGYILKMFPRLSETFVMNELLELERQGADVSVFSLMHPGDGRFHGRLSDLRLTAKYYTSQKPESYWDAIHRLPPELTTPFERWHHAIGFLRRYETPRDLEFLLRALMIASEVRARGIQHLHAHFATISTRMATVVGMLTGVPFSFTAHAKDIFRDTVNRDLFSEMVRRSAFCVTVSDFNRAFILEHTPNIDASKVHRLYNGVDLTQLTSTEDSRSDDVPHIVSVGRLVPKKGFDDLLRALRRVKDDGIRFCVTIAGGGDEWDRLHAIRTELDLEDEVSMPGALPHERVIDLLREADLIALACVPDADGNMDALPTVLLEALALGVPIVSTRLTGIPEIVDDETGVLVTPGDVAALARAIRSVVERSREHTGMQDSCRARAGQLFDLSLNVAELHGRFRRNARVQVST
ncbi:MAG: glycosyltransferase [Acidobacteriota bacterium]|nr:glycosyltransferase [Acidobacteriota bacterium]MDH3785331.1 glycosyltransferase [Acidobacteriota bacterium]